MADEILTLFCLVDGTSKAFHVEIESAKTISHLERELVVLGQARLNEFTLWRVNIPGMLPGTPIRINAIEDKTELNNARTTLSDLFPTNPDNNTYILVQPTSAPPPSGELIVSWSHV